MTTKKEIIRVAIRVAKELNINIETKSPLLNKFENLMNGDDYQHFVDSFVIGALIEENKNMYDYNYELSSHSLTCLKIIIGRKSIKLLKRFGEYERFKKHVKNRYHLTYINDKKIMDLFIDSNGCRLVDLLYYNEVRESWKLCDMLNNKISPYLFI